MRSDKKTNVLLTLIFLALLAHLIAPLFAAREAVAVGPEAVPPSVVAADAQNRQLDNAAGKIADALREIAKSNQQIARAIDGNAKSNERIANSLQDVAKQIKSIKVSAPSQDEW